MIELDEMKRRVLKAHKYKEDLVEPLSEVLELDKEEVVDLVIERLDMIRLQGLHSRNERRREDGMRRILEEKINMDLHLPLLSNFLSILDEESAKQIKEEAAEKVLAEDKEYEKALEEAKEEIQGKLGDIR